MHVTHTCFCRAMYHCAKKTITITGIKIVTMTFWYQLRNSRPVLQSRDWGDAQSRNFGIEKAAGIPSNLSDTYYFRCVSCA